MYSASVLLKGLKIFFLFYISYSTVCRIQNFSCSDRCRTTNNMLGDSYGAAVVEALSRKELEAMDSEAGVKKEVKGEDEEALIGLYKTESGLETGSNGSSVKVREVHLLRRCAMILAPHIHKIYARSKLSLENTLSDI